MTRKQAVKTSSEGFHLSILAKSDGTSKRDRLRSFVNSSFCRIRDHRVLVVDSVGSCKYDLHQFDRPRRNKDQEVTLRAFPISSSMFRRARRNSNKKNESIHIHVIFRRRRDMQRGEPILVSPQGFAVVLPYVNPPPEPLEIAPQPPKRSKPRTRRWRKPFCACFSPSVSDSDDEDRTDGIQRVSRNGMNIEVPMGRPWSISSVNEEVRRRLALAGVFEDQSNRPNVHRIIEYGRHLVGDIDQIYASTYYWGVMDRYKAEELLEGKEEGTFLLRDSAQDDYLFSVSFRRYQRTLHARIEQMNHRFSFDVFDPNVFSSKKVTDLIENYKDPSRCLFYEPQLTHPLPRKSVFSLAELCRAKVLSNTTYDAIPKLPLPFSLTNFLRQYYYSVPLRVHDLNN
ncbi:unnamed protein product [Caenorhabditis auriculariae]|uniref:Suppressor of cytokine signaling 5 n=1 Tax=Caenorhabditis auriculariae TaxID=2777116 RepID=A0A8S1HAH0_9PELO|nr:unnamed protein product [Caenorhabditis auriculariae]